MSFFVLTCKERKKEDIEIYIEKKEQLNSHCLQIKLTIKNNSKQNYLVPVSPEFFLDNDMKIVQAIPSKIITSDFANNYDDRQEFVLQEFTEKKRYKGFSHQVYKMAISKYYEEYSNSLFFIPKNSERELVLAFNDYSYHNSADNRNEIFNDKFTKIKMNHYAKEDVITIDSLMSYNKLNYTVYRKNIYLKDSLYINK